MTRFAKVDIRFHHAGLVVPDLDAAADWYEKMFGFERERSGMLPDIPAEILFLKRDEMRLELFLVPAAKPSGSDRSHPNTDVMTEGFKHIAFLVESVKDTVDELQRRGAELVFTKSFGLRSAAFFRDASGNLVEIVEDRTEQAQADAAHGAAL